jgi:CheY-like chemotaxis protein
MTVKKSLILIADDEIRLGKLVSDFLLNSGFGVLTVTDGKQAFDIFNEYRIKIDLIILDVMMSLMDGWQVLKEIKSISSVPIIMLTAKAEESDQKTGREVLSFIQKLNSEGKTIVMITHDESIASMAKRNIYVEDGMINQNTGKKVKELS